MLPSLRAHAMLYTSQIARSLRLVESMDLLAVGGVAGPSRTEDNRSVNQAAGKSLGFGLHQLSPLNSWP